MLSSQVLGGGTVSRLLRLQLLLFSLQALGGCGVSLLLGLQTLGSGGMSGLLGLQLLLLCGQALLLRTLLRLCGCHTHSELSGGALVLGQRLLQRGLLAHQLLGIRAMAALRTLQGVQLALQVFGLGALGRLLALQRGLLRGQPLRGRTVFTLRIAQSLGLCTQLSLLVLQSSLLGL